MGYGQKTHFYAYNAVKAYSTVYHEPNICTVPQQITGHLIIFMKSLSIMFD